MDPPAQSSLEVIATAVLQEFRDGGLNCQCVHGTRTGCVCCQRHLLTLSGMFSFFTRRIYSVFHEYLKIKNKRMKGQLTLKEQDGRP